MIKANPDEIHIETHEQTFTDNAVKYIGQRKAECTLCLMYGTCSESDCKECPINKFIHTCEASMNEYDKLRVNVHAASDARFFAQEPSRFYGLGTWLLLKLMQFVLLLVFIGSIYLFFKEMF